MGLPIATQGSSSTHGGNPTSFAGTSTASGLKIVRVGDTFSCPTHGAQVISSGSGTNSVEGLKIARVGDSISCGAVLTNGISTITVG